MNDLGNPFNITKAVDFSDQQINDYWVDLPGGAGFREMVKPTSPMPMLIIGGKGSGKTHLMRHFSYPLQKLRHTVALQGVKEEGYIGIYLRSGGLNAARFKEKGQSKGKWSTVFAYYMDLWLAQLVLEITQDVLGHELSSHVGVPVAEAIANLFDVETTWHSQSIHGVLSTLRAWQKEIDHAVNNAAISRELSVQIRSSPGRLPFGVPRVLGQSVGDLAGLKFLYLIDELENLTEDQQRYVNTLVREREEPTSFKIGARLYGVRTYETYSAGESNVEGSEYEKLSLDDQLRNNRNYPLFARQLVARRISEAGYLSADAAPAKKKEMAARVAGFFESTREGLYLKDETDVITSRSQGAERPYFAALRAKLSAGIRMGLVKGVASDAEIEAIIHLLQVPQYPLIEKANLHVFYKAWSARRNLRQAAERIRGEADNALLKKSPNGALKTTLSHFKGDLLAQLYSDFEQKPQYIGVETFIDMSRGLPKNLLVILKHVVQWATFNGERPFRGQPISRKAQQKGVAEAAQWFFREAEVIGEDADTVQNAIRRLAELFRDIRYSDKPAECSLSTFSTEMGELSQRSREMIKVAESLSLLVRIGHGQRDKNSTRVDAKYQINSMLAPIWDLPISRRGALALGASEVNSIFDPEFRDAFENVRRVRVARMTAPKFDGESGEDAGRLSLFGMADD